MKRLFIFLLLALLLASLFRISNSAGQDYSVNTIFQDDFEYYAIGTFPSDGGWHLTYSGAGAEYQAITTKAAHSGFKSLQLVGQAWWSACADKYFTSNADLIGFEAFVMVNNFGSTPDIGDKTTAAVHFVNPLLDSWGRAYALLRFGSDGKIYAVTAEGWLYLQDFTLNEWNKIRVTVNKTTDTFNIWINDQLKATNLSIERGHATEITALRLASGHAGASVYFDDVKVFEVQPKIENSEIVEFFVPFAPKSIYGGRDAGDSISVVAFYGETVLKVDADGNGNFEFEDVLDKGELKVYAVTEGAYISASKPVSVIVQHFENDYEAYDDGLLMYEAIPVSRWGIDYWIPEAGSGLKIIASQSSTYIAIDNDTDGLPEKTWILNRGDVATYSNPAEGAHVTANKPVMLVVYNAEPSKESGTWAYTVFPNEMLGVEYYFEGQQMFEATPVSDQTRVSIIAIEDQTNVKIDADADEITDITRILNKGETLKINDPQAGLRIQSDKKIAVAYLFWKTAPDPWTSALRDYASAHMLLPIDQLGTEYVVMTSNNPGWAPQYINEIRIVSIKNNTEVNIDLNWDGVYEFSKVLKAGEIQQYIPPWITQHCWAHVLSNNPLIVVGAGQWNPPPHIEMKYSYICVPFTTLTSITELSELLSKIRQAKEAALEFSRFNLEDGVSLSADMLKTVAADVAGGLVGDKIKEALNIDIDKLPLDSRLALIGIDKVLNWYTEKMLEKVSVCKTATSEIIKEIANARKIAEMADLDKLTQLYEQQYQKIEQIIHNTMESWQETGPPKNLENIVSQWSTLLDNYIESLNNAKNAASFYISPNRIGTIGQTAETKRWWNSPYKTFSYDWGLILLKIAYSLLGYPTLGETVTKIMGVTADAAIIVAYYAEVYSIVDENAIAYSDFYSIISYHIIPSLWNPQLYETEPITVSDTDFPDLTFLSPEAQAKISCNYNWQIKANLRPTIALFDVDGKLVYWNIGDKIEMNKGTTELKISYSVSNAWILWYLIKHYRNPKLSVKAFIHIFSSDPAGNNYLYGPIEGEITVKLIDILAISLGSPADLHVYDAENRHIGLNYETGKIEIEIPNAFYSGPYTEPQLVLIPEPSTQQVYRIEIIGKTDGTYNLTSWLLINGTTTQPAQKIAEINKGETQKLTLIITENGQPIIKPSQEGIPMHYILIIVLVIAVISIILYASKIKRKHPILSP